jgi:DNA-binding transcriptional LysR family regulator
MNVGLRQLKVFLAVAKHGSFSRAAEDIGSSQSAVSLAIRQVETELGVKLLDRTTRQVQLTSIGETLVATSARLLNELDTVLRELRDIGVQHRGTVAMACVPSIARSLMPRCIEYCSAKWPNVSFLIEDVAAKEVVQKVVRGEIEFGISSGFIGESDLEIHTLMTDPFLVVCRRDDVFAKRRAIAWLQLGDRHLVMLNNTSAPQDQRAYRSRTRSAELCPGNGGSRSRRSGRPRNGSSLRESPDFDYPTVDTPSSKAKYFAF